jgi:hypothetical protein
VRRGWLSLLLLLVAASLAFVVLMTVSERFFCPALELISDYLKLPPVVAGATLLSFGNGAPDTFTQVAAIGQVGLCWQQRCNASHLGPVQHAHAVQAHHSIMQRNTQCLRAACCHCWVRHKQHAAAAVGHGLTHLGYEGRPG